jgi:hypothetical protein
MQKLNNKVTDLPGYRAIGLKWEGAYSGVAALKEMIQMMSIRVSELEQCRSSTAATRLVLSLAPGWICPLFCV